MFLMSLRFLICLVQLLLARKKILPKTENFVERSRTSRDLDLRDQWLGDAAQIVIGYHQGCVDGCAAAHMLRKTLNCLHPTVQVKLVPIGHQKMRFAEPGLIEPGTVLFSVDITPTMEDVEALRKAAVVVLLDHHASEVETQSKLVEACPNILNRSTSSGKDCAASMVFDLVKDVCHFDRDIVHMIHKMDVFGHDLPQHLDEAFVGFKAYLTQSGERNIGMNLVENMFNDSEVCIADGQKRAVLMINNTNSLAASQEIVFETTDWRVIFAGQSIACRPIDLMHYQRQIDEKIDGKPTLVLTQDESPLPNGLFNVGLRRAGETLNITDVAKEFKTKPEVAGGGGHPFAGGVQSKEFLTREKIVEMAVEVMTTLMPEGPA